MQRASFIARGDIIFDHNAYFLEMKCYGIIAANLARGIGHFKYIVCIRHCLRKNSILSFVSIR